MNVFLLSFQNNKYLCPFGSHCWNCGRAGHQAAACRLARRRRRPTTRQPQGLRRLRGDGPPEIYARRPEANGRRERAGRREAEQRREAERRRWAEIGREGEERREAERRRGAERRREGEERRQAEERREAEQRRQADGRQGAEGRRDPTARQQGDGRQCIPDAIDVSPVVNGIAEVSITDTDSQ